MPAILPVWLQTFINAKFKLGVTSSAEVDGNAQSFDYSVRLDRGHGTLKWDAGEGETGELSADVLAQSLTVSIKGVPKFRGSVEKIVHEGREGLFVTWEELYSILG